MKERRFEILDHTADAAIRAHGSNAAELFENAARGMFSLMFDLSEIPRTELRVIKVEARTPEDLLVSWLKELLFLFETEHMAFGDFRVSSLVMPGGVQQGTLVGEAMGGPCAGLVRLGAAVKAVTYHGLRIERAPSGRWQVDIVFDV
jgi:SHS2 domain-containing protein